MVFATWTLVMMSHNQTAKKLTVVELSTQFLFVKDLTECV